MFGFDRGWHEMEYNPATGRTWRWTSDAAALWIRHAGRDLTVRIRGENPLRYFDAAPAVVVRAGSAEVGRFAPDADFDRTFRVPAAALDASDGRLTLTTDRTFVPDDREHNGDRRRLGLRIYAVEIK